MAHRPRHAESGAVQARRGERDTVPAGSRRLLVTLAALLAVATIGGIILLRPRGSTRSNLEDIGVSLPAEVYAGRVGSVGEGPCQGTVAEQNIVCSTLAVRLREGPDAGRRVMLERPKSEASIEYSQGDDVVLAYEPKAPEELRYRIVDRERKTTLLWLAFLFAISVLALGSFRGVAALAGLAATFVVLLLFVLPSILDGRSPLMVSVIGASAIAFLALYLAHGFGPKTTVALLGTLASLLLTAVLGSVFVGAAQISGLASEEATIVSIGAAQIDLAGLILGGVVIGALGAIDDMTVTQASAVWELRAANPGMSARELVRSGLQIGRDHVAATVNTLFLAYAGASSRGSRFPRSRTARSWPPRSSERSSAALGSLRPCPSPRGWPRIRRPHQEPPPPPPPPPPEEPPPPNPLDPEAAGREASVPAEDRAKLSTDDTNP
jgi:hypothetical protein